MTRIGQNRLEVILTQANARLDKIAKTYGVNSQTYQNAIAPFMNDKMLQYTHYTATGRLKLNKSTVVDNDTDYLANVAKGIKTIAEYNKSVKRDLKRSGKSSDYIKSLNAEELHDKQEENAKTKADFDLKYEDFKATFTDAQMKYIAPELYQGNKSYSDMQAIQDRMQYALNHAEEFTDIDEDSDLPFV